MCTLIHVPGASEENRYLKKAVRQKRRKTVPNRQVMPLLPCLIVLTFNIYSGASLPNLGLPSLFKMKDALREYFSYFPPRVFTCFLSQVK